jgi:hypothetical protein
VPWPPHGRDDVIVRSEKGDVRSHGFYAAKALVANHEKVVAFGGVAVFRRVDLAIGTVYADAQHFDEDPAAIGHVRQRRPGEVGEMYAVGLSWNYRDRLH